jgi:hypothetical protein
MMTVGGRVGALWIGGLEPYMDENFLQNAMGLMGEQNVVSIKVMSNKFTGEPAGYGFVNFDSDQTAIVAMHRLGGKIIPNSNPPIRFKLNHNSTRLQQGEVDTSIWVGDLTPEVDDYALYRFFIGRYTSVRCAKVVLDETGFSKGYGFVRFGLEQEQQHALSNMTGELGLGSKPIKVSMANQKNRGDGMGGGVSPPSATWGGVTAWPGPSTSPWPGQSSAPQPLTGGGWAGLTASPLSGGPLSGGPLSGGPLSGGPLSGGPLSGGPLSGGISLNGGIGSGLNGGLGGMNGGLGGMNGALGGMNGGLGGGLGGPGMPGPVSSPSPAAPPTAPSPGPDFNPYQFPQFYQQQLAQQQQQHYAAAWNAWQAQQQRL